MSTDEQRKSLKRKIEDIFVDPDTEKAVENSKKPKIELDANKKHRCIKSIVDMYRSTIDVIVDASGNQDTEMKDASQPSASAMSATTAKFPGKPSSFALELSRNINVGNHITSIIFTLHNICRQAVKGTETNMMKKTKDTSFKVCYRGGEYLIATDVAKALWLSITSNNELLYKDFDQDDKENWYGTMGPYLDMFSAYSLRTNELRLGHNNMPLSKANGVHKIFPVSKYGLSGAHHVLLEGASFPPERRSSIVQSLGPMTAWLGMVRGNGVFRKKYAAAVKRAMSHVPCIDEIIELTKTIKQSSEISSLTTLVAEILLVTTARQATRMFFPITIFASVWHMHANTEQYCNFFSTTGAGGWYTYKKACEAGIPFTICGEMERDKASQITFHSILGTYKEDLSILAQITNVKTWHTREQMGSCFRNQGTSKEITTIELPKVSYYAKMSCANQTGLLSGVYNQVAVVPCFSGRRVTKFDESFFDHIEKRRVVSTTGKTLSQILNILTSTLEELHAILRTDSGALKMGTTSWKDMESLSIDHPGDDVSIVFNGTSKMFLGKN